MCSSLNWDPGLGPKIVGTLIRRTRNEALIERATLLVGSSNSNMDAAEH